MSKKSDITERIRNAKKDRDQDRLVAMKAFRDFMDRWLEATLPRRWTAKESKNGAYPCLILDKERSPQHIFIMLPAWHNGLIEIDGDGVYALKLPSTRTDMDGRPIWIAYAGDPSNIKMLEDRMVEFFAKQEA